MEGSSWTAALLGFFGALAGGTLSALISSRGSRRQRLEDAYAEFAGAVTLLLQISIQSVFGDNDSDAAWVQLGTCQARLWLQQEHSEARAKVQGIRTSLKDLYSINIQLGDDVDHQQEREEQGIAHLEKMRRVEEQLSGLLMDARKEIEALQWG